MKFSKETAEIFVPDNLTAGEAVRRTTHMAVGAHPDDLEIMALDGILACFKHPDHWFLGVVVTNGAGSPRDGLYAKFSDEEMRRVRRTEQKKAATVGEFGAVVFLDHASSEIKNADFAPVKDDLRSLFGLARPEVVYIHNLADKHDTHVATALRTIGAIRELPPEMRPSRLFGCEVWRGLDWMVDRDKVVFAFERHENIAMSLVALFDSQIAGGKRYDLATMGRRRANASYLESHAVDTAQLMNFAMDLTPLIRDENADPCAYVQQHLDRLSRDIAERIQKFS